MAESADTKTPKGFWSKNIKTLRIGLGMGLAIGILVVLLGLDDHGFLAKTELLTLDFRYRMRPQIPVNPEVAYVDYDDASLALFGSWPWPRHRQVALVNMMDFYDARAAGYDVFFTEKNDIAVLDQRLKKFVNEAKPGQTSTDQVMQTLRTAIRDYDRDFEKAIQKAGNVYLGYFVEEPDKSIAKGGVDAIQAHIDEYKKGEEYQKKQGAIEALDPYTLEPTPELKKSVFKMVDITPPLSGLTRASAGAGYAQIVHDLDQTVRLYPICMYYDGKMYPSIACTMLSKILDAPLNTWRVVPGEDVEIPNALVPGETQRETIRIPINENAQMLTNWAGRFDDVMLHLPFRYVSEYYAYYTAKNLARTYPSEPSSYDALRREIVNSIDEEGMVTEDQSRRIASEIALAHVATPLIRAGKSRAEILAALPPAAKSDAAGDTLTAVFAGIRAADTDAHAQADPALAAFDPAWKAEIDRNAAWFKSKNRLADVAPYFFPPTRQVQWNGARKDFSPLDIENKIFMIGLTGVGTIDLNPMPYQNVYAMVGLHSNALNTILVRKFLHYPQKFWRYPLDIGTAVLTALFGALTSPFIGFLICELLTLLFSGAVVWAFIEHGQWIYWFEPVLTGQLTFIAIVVYHFMEAQKEKGRVRAIFSAMVSPAVLKLMEDHPERFSLSGVRKPATMMFSAIEKFGKVSAGVAPDDLVGVLSIYLTPTSEIIMDYGGYIDKYEGHVIMADFGVPLDDPGHAWKCAFSSIEQQQDIEPFQFYIKAHYGADVHVAMGVNSGYVSAGNMGSEKKMQYTVMGDAVNMSARFRPANGIYDTRIITGEASEPILRDVVELRLLDKLLAKGKTIPITIYEVQGWKPDAYLKLKGGDPLPSSLITRWTKCPAEKIFGYHEFWSRKEKDVDHAIVKQIREFFESQLPAAEEMVKLDGRFEIQKYHEELTALRADAGQILSKSVNGAGGAGRSWDAILDHWIHSAETLRAALQEHKIAPGADPLALAAYSGALGRADTLVNKLHSLKPRLSFQAHTESVVERFLVNQHEAIEKTAATETSLAPVSAEDIDAKRQAYHAAVNAFHQTLAADPKPYHEMMALVGDTTPTQKKARELFEAGVNLHWERKWDDSIQKFRAVLDLVPTDGPSKAYLERIEGYKTEPPGEKWQGEFVQKKK